MQSTAPEARHDTSHHPKEPLLADENLTQAVDIHLNAFLRAHNIEATPPEGTRVTLPPTEEFPWRRSYLKRPGGEDELHYSSPDSVVVFSIYRRNPLEGTGFKHTVYDLNRPTLPRNTIRLGKKIESFATSTGIIESATAGQNGHDTALTFDVDIQIVVPASAEIPLTEGAPHPV